MTAKMEILNIRIVCVLVREEILQGKCVEFSSEFLEISSHRCLDVTTIWISSFSIEQSVIQVHIVSINSIAKCDCDHLRSFVSW